jgi:SAM-dependent methyltransferase
LNGATVLDYGCGEGLFLHDLSYALAEADVRVQLLGYEPYMDSNYTGYEVVSDASRVPDESVDTLTCLEVCEHLSDDETARFIEFAQRVLRPGGNLLVTVPIMVGPALLLKELSRSVLHRRRPDLTVRELTRASLIAVPPPRADDIKTSHRGYDWRTTSRVLSDAFTMMHVGYSPLPYRHWYGQSQVLMTFRR